MTYYGGKELAASFRTVRSNTITIAEDIPESQYDFRAAPDTRTIRQTLVHIALIPSFSFLVHDDRGKVDDLATVNFPELVQKTGAEEARPRDKAATVAFLKSEGERFASFLEGLSRFVPRGKRSPCHRALNRRPRPASKCSSRLRRNTRCTIVVS